MARRERALTKDTTQTAGTGTYTLDGATAAGYQTLAEAVARGLAANGDEVIYRVSDAASPVLYEVGRGTIGSAGLTVTRAEILERDDGSTSPKSWPSGGARNFVVTFWPAELVKAANNGTEFTAATFATNLGLPRLSAANTYTEPQRMAKSVAAGQHKGVAVANTAAASASNEAALDLLCMTSVQERTAGLVTANFTDTADGTRASRIRFGLFHGAAFVVPLTITGGGITDGSGNRYVAFPTGGTVKMLFASAPPAGWTRVNETNQAIIRLATAADTPNASGGSDSLFDGGWSTAGHALATAELAAHSHSLGGGGAVSFVGAGASANYTTDPGDPDAASQVAFYSNTDTAGSGASHSHNMTTPYYRIACWATYN